MLLQSVCWHILYSVCDLKVAQMNVQRSSGWIITPRKQSKAFDVKAYLIAVK